MPLLFRGDSHLLGRGLPALPARLALRILYSQFAAVTCVGIANRAYFRALGVPESRLFLAPHSVNAEHFNPADPATQRAAVVLRYYEDRSEADIADLLGVRPGTVKSLLHRGLVGLREVIEP